MKTIEIKDIYGKVIFTYEAEENSLLITLKKAVSEDANLRGANLRYADLHGADLRDANLRDADLHGANLRDANLRGANLRYANLHGADLHGADLRDANLRGAIFYPLQCPEEGAFIGWKKCMNGKIIKLLIPAEARRSSATSRKCRAEFADVLEVIGGDGKTAASERGGEYEVGKRTYPDKWDECRWNECSNGIHFFITREEAENY